MRYCDKSPTFTFLWSELSNLGEILDWLVANSFVSLTIKVQKQICLLLVVLIRAVLLVVCEDFSFTPSTHWSCYRSSGYSLDLFRRGFVAGAIRTIFCATGDDAVWNNASVSTPIES